MVTLAGSVGPYSQIARHDEWVTSALGFNTFSCDLMEAIIVQKQRLEKDSPPLSRARAEDCYHNEMAQMLT